jgi:hypothetical protein
MAKKPLLQWPLANHPPFQNAAIEALKLETPKTPIERIYHYTDARGLLGIVETGILRLTDAAFLNDGSEVSYGLELCAAEFEAMLAKAPEREKAFGRRIIELIQANQPRYRPAVFCASLRDNLLNQWRDYGREEVSYSIGFDIKGLVRLQRASFEVTIAKLIYDLGRQRKVLRKVMRAVRTELRDLYRQGWVAPEHEDDLVAHAAVEISRVLYWLKNPGFEAEEEVRIFSDVPTIMRAGQVPEFRAGRLGVVPYFNWKWDAVNNTLPLAHILVGPSPHGEVAASAVEGLLAQRKYGNVPVEYSTIPWRR